MPEIVFRRRFARRSHWLAGAGSVVALPLVIAGGFVIDALSGDRLSGNPLVMVALVVAAVPALVWLSLFYRLDRREPEPAALVLEVFVLGALVALAVGNPILDAYDLADWTGRSPILTLLSAVLIVGFLQESLKYASLRFSVYRSNEFDQLQDGVVYGTAVGLGYATALNFVFVLQSGGADLGPVALRVSITALAQGSFGGIVGYFLAGQKLQRRPVWWSLLGVSGASLLNGLFYYTRALVAQGPTTLGGLPTGSWTALVISAVGAGAVAVGLAALVRREEHRKTRGMSPG